MKVVTVKLEPLNEGQPVRVIGVQLESPFASGELKISEDPRVGLGEWVDRGLGRVDRLRALMPKLLDLASTKPSIIAFPEYSVPLSAHAALNFAREAVDRNCIIIPGSYYESPEPGFRRNICRIYLPSGTHIDIGKLVPTRWEQKHVDPAHTLPNTAKLVWPGPKGKQACVNVFLCRDYLLGMREHRGKTRSDDNGWRSAGTSDFDSQGLNLTLMHSRDIRLFEGVSGLELRSLRGKPRLSVHLNCANTGAMQGSALLGLLDERERDDVVCSLPSDREAVLMADLHLMDVRAERVAVGEGGGLAVVPIWKIKTLGVDKAGALGEMPVTAPEATPEAPKLYRAVWRPAFLEAIEMVVTIEFLVSPNIAKAKIDLASGCVEDIYAGVARGEFDLCVRKYMHSHDVPDIEHVNFLAKYDDGPASELSKLLDHSRTWKMRIKPSQILKYRGTPTETGADYERLREKAKQVFRFGQVMRDLDERSRKIDEILGWAEGKDKRFEIPAEYADFLYPNLEEDIPLGEAYDTRETYIAVWLNNVTDGKPASKEVIAAFEADVIRGQVMRSHFVREIFQLQQSEEHRTPAFLLKLKCNVWRSDDMVSQLRAEGNSRTVTVSTRTIDINHHLAKTSLRGVLSTNIDGRTRDFINLFSTKVGKDKGKLWFETQKGNNQSRRIITAVAANWSRTDDATPARIPSDMRDDIFEFWCNVLLNYAELQSRPAEPAAQRARPTAGLIKSQQIFSTCFQYLNRQYSDVLLQMFRRGVFPDVGGTNSESEDKRMSMSAIHFAWPDIPRDPKQRTQKQTEDYRSRMTDVAMQFYGVMTRIKDRLPRSTAILLTRDAEGMEKLRPLRNAASHQYGEKLAQYSAKVDLSDDDYEIKIKDLADDMAGFIGLLDRALEVGELVRQGRLDLASQT